MEYNGWTNYETWNVSLWVENEEGMYLEMVKNRPFSANSAREFVESLMPDGTPDFDDTTGDYDDVNWDEIAESFNEE